MKIIKDLTPDYLTFVVSNEAGGFVILKTANGERHYAVYRTKSLTGDNVILTELTISSGPREATKEELKQLKK